MGTQPRSFHGLEAPFGFRPAASDGGVAAPFGGSLRSSAGLTPSALAKASKRSIVTFSDPRSTRPTYERSVADSKANRSCDKPFETRSLRRFQPMISRTFIYGAASPNCGLTIDGLTVPYL